MSGFEQVVADQAAATAPQPGVTFPEVVPTSAPQQPQVTSLDDGSVVVNGKIYKPEAAAKKIEHADTHIKTLEQENAEKDAVALTLLARIEALEANRNQTDAIDKLVAEARPAPVTYTPEPPPTQEVSKEELVQAAVDTIKGEQVAQQQDANLNACIAQAQTAYGDDFSSKIDAAGRAHGMSVDNVVEMAKNQPSVFKALFIPEARPTGQPDTTRSTLAGMVGQGEITSPINQKSFLKMNAKERAAEVNRRMAALSTTG